MRCPTLAELPPPPPGRTGWPWTEETPQLPDVMPNGNEWPEVSIVTPSYNQGQYLEETIRSVLLQGYPNLQYIIIDGGSTDNSVDIIRKYEPWLDYWVSEKDRGQSDAINKGWNLSSGEVLAWLNSDDYYAGKGVIKDQVQALNSEDSVGLVYGDCFYITSEGRTLGSYPTKNYSYIELLRICYIAQPTVFLKRDVFLRVGQLDIGLQLALDYDYWLRCSSITNFVYTRKLVATYRLHTQSKTVSSIVKHAFESSEAICRHIYGVGSNRLSYDEKKHVLSGALLTVALSAAKTGDIYHAYHLAMTTRRITLRDPRFVFVLLAAIDYLLGTKIEAYFVNLYYAARNGRLGSEIANLKT